MSLVGLIMTKRRDWGWLAVVMLLGGCAPQTRWEKYLAPDPTLQQQPFQWGQSLDAYVSKPLPATIPVTLPANFPQDLPLVLQAQLIQSQMTDGGTETLWIAPASLAEVTDFYTKRLPPLGWQIQAQMNRPGAAATGFRAIRAGEELTLRFSPTTNPKTTNLSFLIAYRAAPMLPTAPPETPGSPGGNPVGATWWQGVPDSLRSPLTDLFALNLLRPAGGDPDWKPGEPVTRRQYARWLFAVYNRFYDDLPDRQIRPAAIQGNTPVFSDLTTSDPDFATIQGLAEAGVIPSRLTQGSAVLAFGPDLPLTRETLILWKIPLDLGKTPPPTNLQQVQAAWGFTDLGKSDPQLWPLLKVDAQNQTAKSDRSTLRRVFGYTKLLQPDKSVTGAEAAASLWAIGYGDRIRTAKDLATGTGTQPLQ